MNIILIILLFLLMIYIDIKRGIKLFLSILFNFIILMIIFYLIAIGLNPIICSLIGCFIISYIILYYVNERNVKTESSLKSVIIVLIILSFLIFFVTKISRIAGFGYESYEEINMFSYDVKIDFTNIAISMILISLIGATVDSSIAISSALYEVYDNNKNLSKKDLFLSGMNIGKDILCTTNNTLMFAFLGEFMTLLIWFYKGDYSFLEIVNAKTFVSEMIKILFSAVGCIIVIPITAYITTETLKKDDKNN
ncbi:MAG: YibE/F family protein [Clostridium sp.]|jgi:yibE/F family protein|nr:YibE/F family protein [Clostridium sp.]MEE0092130.1 YibE/F family protein [Bacilli bacterium]